MYLIPELQKPAGEFVTGPLWADIKRALRQRCPSYPDTKDPSHVASAKGHQRAGFEKAIEELEKLPFEYDKTANNPLERPAVTITED